MFNFELIKQEINKTEKFIGEMLENPKLILTDLYNKENNYLKIVHIFDVIDKNYNIFKFQEETYNDLIKYLKENLDSELDFNFDRNIIGTTINIKFLNYRIGFIYLNNKSIKIYPLTKSIECILKTKEFDINRLKEAEEDEIRYKNYTENIFKIAENFQQFVYILFHQRFVKKQLKKTIKDKISKVSRLKKYLNDTNESLQKLQDDKDIVESKILKVKEYFENLGYEIEI